MTDIIILAVFAMQAALAHAVTPSTELGSSSLFEVMPAEGLPPTYQEFLKRIDTPLSGLVGRGRSLQRGAVTFSEPRIVSIPLKGRAKDRVFMAIADRAKQMEIISYNRERGDYDFFLVKNVGLQKGAAKPILQIASAKLCSDCHQGGAAIFSTFPWPETNLTMGYVREQISRFHKKEYGGVPVNFAEQRGTDNGGFDFNTAVLVSNRLVQYRRFYRELGATSEMRKLLVRAAFGRITESEIKALGAAARTLEATARFKFPNGLLPSDGPIADESAFKTTDATNAKAPRNLISAFEPTGGTSSTFIGLELFSPARDDESAGRTVARYAAVGLGVDEDWRDGVANFTTLIDREITWPLSPARARAELTNAPEASGVAWVKKHAASIETAPEASLDPKVILQLRCAPCHAGASPIGGTLPLDDREALKRFVSPIYSKNVATILAEGIMPPSDGHPLEPGEKEALLAYLRAK